MIRRSRFIITVPEQWHEPTFVRLSETAAVDPGTLAPPMWTSPLSARLTRCPSSRRRSLVSTDSGRSALDAGTRLHAPKPSLARGAATVQQLPRLLAGRAHLYRHLPITTRRRFLIRPPRNVNDPSSAGADKWWISASGSPTRRRANLSIRSKSTTGSIGLTTKALCGRRRKRFSASGMLDKERSATKS